jgi:hypothetical protein
VLGGGVRPAVLPRLCPPDSPPGRRTGHGGQPLAALQGTPPTVRRRRLAPPRAQGRDRGPHRSPGGGRRQGAAKSPGTGLGGSLPAPT